MRARARTGARRRLLTLHTHTYPSRNLSVSHRGTVHYTPPPLYSLSLSFSRARPLPSGCISPLSAVRARSKIRALTSLRLARMSNRALRLSFLSLSRARQAKGILNRPPYYDVSLHTCIQHTTRAEYL